MINTLKNIITSATWIAAVITIWLGSTMITAEASEKEKMDAVAQAYEQLITEDKTVAVVHTNEDLLTNNYEFFAALMAIDKDDTLYDGQALEARSWWEIKKTGKDTYEVYMRKNAFDRKTCDKFVDMLLADLNSTYDYENATPREKFYNIASYITRTYTYDYESMEKGEIPDTFISAYYTDRKIVCTSYALLLYLMCNKSGVDCEIIAGNEHDYNIVRFGKDEPYYGVDLAASEAGYIDPISAFADIHNYYHADRIEDTKLRKYTLTENNGKTYALAPLREHAGQSFYYISNGRLQDFKKFSGIKALLALFLLIDAAIVVKRVALVIKRKLQ